MKEITIDESSASQRFDRFLRKYFKHTPEIGLGDIFSWIRKWSIKVNGKKKKQDYRLIEWDSITWDDKITTDKKAKNVLQKKSKKVAQLSVQKLKDHIVQESDEYIIRNKPAHLLIHPGDKHTSDITLHDMMVSYLTQTDQRNATQTYSPSFCYRLDKDTSGVVISAKTFEALQYLNQCIRERQTKKAYTAVLIGDLSQLDQKKTSRYSSHVSFRGTNIMIKAPLFVGYNRSTWRSQSFVNTEKGKDSKSEIQLIKTITHPQLWPLSLVKVIITTWRMHQIRVHTAHIGYPILWDLTYGNPALNRKASKNGITRQLLHASSYWFYNKFVDKQQTFAAELPIEFDLFL